MRSSMKVTAGPIECISVCHVECRWASRSQKIGVPSNEFHRTSVYVNCASSAKFGGGWHEESFGVHWRERLDKESIIQLCNG